MRKASLLVAGLLVMLTSAELIARHTGILDFPLYEANPNIGYIPAANQKGSFLKRNKWQFNELHMGSKEFTPNVGVDTLLVGDSIVLGGNPISQEDRLAAQLEKNIGGQVWSIAAGSWSISNELTYLESNPAVLKNIDQIVFVLNSGDLTDESSHWRCDRHHPRSKPISALWQGLEKKYLKLEDCNTTRPDLTPAPRKWQPRLHALLQKPPLSDKPVFALIYPDRNQIQTTAAMSSFDREMNEQLAPFKPKLKIIGVSASLNWGPGMYRDGIHPNQKGYKELASIIASSIK